MIFLNKNLYSVVLRIIPACLAFVFFPLSSAMASDIQAVLDSTDGSSGFIVQDSANAARVRILSNGNLGIGTVSPQGSLEILKLNSVVPLMVSSLASTHGDYFVVTNGGNVGIGTSSPSSMFELGASSQFKLNSSGAITAVTGITNSGPYTQTGVSANTFTGTTTFSNASLAAYFTGGNVGIGTTTPAGALAVMSGNVGVGTWSPSLALDVEGSGVRIGNGVFNHPSGQGNDLYVTNNLEVDGNVWLGDAITDNLTVQGTFAQQGDFSVDGGNFGVGTTTPQTRLAVVGGNVGIGTWTTTNALSLVGGATIGSVGYANTPAPTNGLLVSGNVGIGTTTPTAGLSVMNGNVGIGTWNPNLALDVQGSGVRIGNGTFNHASGLGNDLYVTNNLEVDGNVWLGDATADNLTVQGTFAQSGDFTVNGGNLGVGTTTPQTRLAVVGGNVGIGTWTTTSTINVDGNAAVGDGAAYRTLTAPSNGLLVQGTVGVGTFAPNSSTSLAVAGGVSVGSGQAYTNTFAAPTDGLMVQGAVGIGTFNALSAKMIVQGGNVGIGTNTPQSLLAVVGGNVGIGTWTADANRFAIIGSTTIGSAVFANKIAPDNSLLVSGNIGIGTWSFSNRFSVGLGAPAHAMTVDDAYFANDVEVKGVLYASTIVGGQSLSGDLELNGNFIKSSVGGVYIDPNGDHVPEIDVDRVSLRVGIGTTTMSSELTVSGNASIGSGYNTIAAPTDGLIVQGNVGVGTNLPDAGLDIKGTVAMEPSAVTNITAGGGVTVTRGIMRIQGSGGAVDITANPQIAAGVDGQLVTLIGASNANTVKLENGTGLSLNSGISFTLGLGDTITLIYDATNSVWSEVSRADN